MRSPCKLCMAALSEPFLEQALAMQNRIFGENMSVEYLREIMENPNYVYLLLLENANVAGLICYLQNAFEAELIDIAVDESLRGNGLAKMLMDEMVRRVQESGIREIYLEVRQSNAAALALYAKYRFEQVGLRKAYYAAPVEDAIVMRKMW